MKITLRQILFITVVIVTLCSFIFNPDKNRTYYKNGKVESELFFDEKCNCTKYFEYWENGVVRTKKQYRNHAIDGKDSTFDKNGHLLLASEYDNGVQIGTQISLYKSGKTAYIQKYQDGYKHSTWKYFNEQGQLTKTIEYKDSVVKWDSDLESNTTKYYKNGILFLKEEFLKNKIIDSEIINRDFYTEYKNRSIKTGKGLFLSNCSMCHFKNSEVIAPILKNVKSRHKKVWIINKIKNDDLIIKDDEFIAYKKKWGAGKHPNFENLSDTEIERIIDFVN